MSNLSDVFKYISHFRHAGHQVGRKVGDMLEVLTYAAIARDTTILSRLHVEPKLFGFSEAGHKVEFTLLNAESYNADRTPKIKNGGSITNVSNVIGFIECKKVGVEQTVNGAFKKEFTAHNNKSYVVPFNHLFKISFAPRGEEKHTYRVKFRIDGDDRKILITKDEDEDFSFEEIISAEERIIFALCDDNTSCVFGNDESLRDFEGTLKNCRILEIISVGGANVIALLNDCLPGPQTPEKAKQSSFVALDVRKRRFNSFDKRIPENQMVSVLVLTEFSHWEQKSLNMIISCIDKNLVVDDSIIVEAFEAFEEHFGAVFYDKITKDNFEKHTRVREIALRIVNAHDGKIFRDIEDNVRKKLSVANNQLTFIS